MLDDTRALVRPGHAQPDGYGVDMPVEEAKRQVEVMDEQAAHEALSRAAKMFWTR